MSGDLRRGNLAWSLFALGELAALVYVTLPTGGVLSSCWYLGLSFYGVGLAVMAAVRMRGVARRIWLVLAAGLALFAGGDVIWTVDDQVFHVAPFPSSADVLYLAAYPVLAVALLAMVRRRQSGNDRGALLDALLVTTGVAVLTGVLVLLPAMTDSSSTVISRLVSSAYPLGDLVLLAVLARLTATAARGSVAVWALCGGQLAVLGSDAVYNFLVIAGQDVGATTWLDLGWLQVYLLSALAALHPTARELTEPAPLRRERLTVRRLRLLGGAALLAPASLLLQRARGEDLHPVFVSAGSVLLFLLVLGRLAGLIGELQRQAVVLEALARTDSLTGLPNRRTWEHELARLHAAAVEHQHPLTVALLDVDGLQRYNDTRGHLGGDRLLRETAQVWLGLLAGRGVLARLGGDGFALAVPTLPIDDVAALVETLCLAVPDGQTARAGLSSLKPTETAAAALLRADSGLYVARRRGTKVVVGDGGLGAHDLDDGEPAGLVPLVVFQPIVELATGAVVAVEALSRFAHSDLPPDEIFAKAWLRGTGPQLEAAAVRAVLAARPALGGLPLHVNVSARGLLAPAVLDALHGDLTGVVVEITEQDLSTDEAAFRSSLSRVRAAGARLAIDDFGVGFSNLRRMIELQPDVIKLDRSLVTDVHVDRNRAAVISAVASQACAGRRELCAEGVETEAERRALILLGVRHGQGYLFSRPVPLEEIGALRATGCLPVAGVAAPYARARTYDVVGRAPVG